MIGGRDPVLGVSTNPLIGLRPSDMQHVPVGVPLRDLAPTPRGLLVCRLNGEWLLREGWDRPSRADDVIEWYDVPQDKEDFRSILQIAAIVVSFFNPAAGAWLMAASMAYNMLVPPTALKPPPKPEQTGDGATTGLAGNEARLDQPIPKTCGRREFNPPLACQPYLEFRSKAGEPDPYLDNEQYFFALFAVGIGDHDVVAKIGNTPVSRFADVVTAQYLAPGEAPSTVEANVTTAGEVAGQVLESGQYVGGFSACAPNRRCSAIGVDIMAPRGLGRESALTVTWRVEYRPINDFGQLLGSWSPLGSEQSRTAFTSSPQRWSVRYEINPPARVEVRVVRTDIKDEDPVALHELVWQGLRAYLDEEAPLNEHCAHYEVVLRASSQLSAGSSRDVRLITEAKCRTLNASLEWQAEVHTRNPAWWILDLATSDTWGMDKPDARVDLQSFYDLAQTCDARQDRFDWVFDSTVNAWDAMQLIARSCRSRVFRRNGVISVARDELADLPVTAFTPRNCQPGMAIEEILRSRVSPDGVVVEYQDHRTWEWTPIECPCPGVGTNMANPILRRLEGVTGATHAEREGLYEAANLLYRQRVASWTTEMQGMLPAYMSPVDFLPDIEGYGHSGDVAYWDNTTLVMGLSEPPDFSGGALYLTLIRDDGTLTTPVLVTPGPTDYDITLPAAPDFSLVLSSGTRERPKYLLGVKELVKVIAIEDGGKSDGGAQLYRLTGVVDDDRVHEADVHLLPGPGDIQDPVGAPNDADDDTGAGTISIVSIAPHQIVHRTIYIADATTGYEIGADGFATANPGGDYFREWMLFGEIEPSVAALYQVRATYTGAVAEHLTGFGDSLSLVQGTAHAPTSGTLDTWLGCETSPSWELYLPAGVDVFVFWDCELFIEIREISTGIVQDSARIMLSSEHTNDGA
jgi:hypothetical protein